MKPYLCYVYYSMFLFYIATSEAPSNYDASLEHNATTARPKLQIMNSYINNEQVFRNNIEEFVKLKTEVNAKTEELIRKEGVILEQREQIRQLLTIYVRQETVNKELEHTLQIKALQRENEVLSERIANMKIQNQQNFQDLEIKILQQLTDLKTKTNVLSVENSKLRADLEKKIDRDENNIFQHNVTARDQKSLEQMRKIETQIDSLKNEEKISKEKQQSKTDLINSVIYAVNCGGEAHVDSNGIYFSKDPLEAPGSVSPMHMGFFQPISGIPRRDWTLYLSVRYISSEDRLTYKIPLRQDGQYVLGLKFSDAYKAPNSVVFDVILNKAHTVLHHFDVFVAAGFAVGHDEYVEFSVKNGHLHYKGSQSFIQDGILTVQFHKKVTHAIIHAIYVIKGNISSVPKLSP